MNHAVKAIVEAMLDCEEMKRFKNTEVISRDDWDKEVPREVKHRLVGQDYVRVGKQLVHITKLGKEILGYKEIAA